MGGLGRLTRQVFIAGLIAFVVCAAWPDHAGIGILAVLLTPLVASAITGAVLAIRGSRLSGACFLVAAGIITAALVVGVHV
jgi:hypothetical protein